MPQKQLLLRRADFLSLLVQHCGISYYVAVDTVTWIILVKYVNTYEPFVHPAKETECRYPEKPYRYRHRSRDGDGWHTGTSASFGGKRFDRSKSAQMRGITD